MLQELGHVLLTNQVPSLWSAHWSGPEQPLAYCAAVAEKASCLGSWLAALAAGRLWSMPLNLAQLFNPGQHCIWHAESAFVMSSILCSFSNKTRLILNNTPWSSWTCSWTLYPADHHILIFVGV